MEERPPIHKTILSQNTLIPLGLLGVIAGVIVTLTTIYINGQQNSVEISRLQLIVAQLQTQNVGVLERTARIETKLDLLVAAIK